MQWWLAYLAIGLVVGFVAGLLGIGGGIVLVPLLALVFAAQGLPAEHLLHIALGTSMATIVFTSLSSMRLPLRSAPLLRTVGRSSACASCLR